MAQDYPLILANVGSGLSLNLSHRLKCFRVHIPYFFENLQGCPLEVDPLNLELSVSFVFLFSKLKDGQVQESHQPQPDPQGSPESHQEAQRQGCSRQQGTRPQVLEEHEVR